MMKDDLIEKVARAMYEGHEIGRASCRERV